MIPPRSGKSDASTAEDKCAAINTSIKLDAFNWFNSPPFNGLNYNAKPTVNYSTVVNSEINPLMNRQN